MKDNYIDDLIAKFKIMNDQHQNVLNIKLQDRAGNTTKLFMIGSLAFTLILISITFMTSFYSSSNAIISNSISLSLSYSFMTNNTDLSTKILNVSKTQLESVSQSMEIGRWFLLTIFVLFILIILFIFFMENCYNKENNNLKTGMDDIILIISYLYALKIKWPGKLKDKNLKKFLVNSHKMSIKEYELGLRKRLTQIEVNEGIYL